MEFLNSHTGGNLTHGGSMKFSLMLTSLAVLSFSSSLLAQDRAVNEFLVKLKPGQSPRNTMKVSKLNGVWSHVAKPLVQDSETSLEELRNDPAVIYAEPNYLVRTHNVPNDPSFSEQWAHQNTGVISEIGSQRAWDRTTSAGTIIVAITDTGMNLNHPELKDNLWSNQKELKGKAGVDDDNNGIIDDIHGANFVVPHPTGDPTDDQGHGTHCAGIIGARGNNGVGVAGVNWEVKMMPVKFIAKNGVGTNADAVRAIDYAVANGAKVINNSWGGGGPSKALQDSIHNGEKNNVLFVFAAGNETDNIDVHPAYPVSHNFSNMIGVASLGKDGLVAPSSNFGPIATHIAAPGRTILSSYTDPEYIIFGGTSMASAFVSGAAAMVWGLNKNFKYSDVKRILLQTSTRSPYLSQFVGSGALNLGEAVNQVP